MIERQTIVTWHTPEEKSPQDDINVVLTISGKNGNITYDHAFVLGSYSEGDGWYIEGIFDEKVMAGITIHAWCDLEPYGAQK